MTQSLGYAMPVWHCFVCEPWMCGVLMLIDVQATQVSAKLRLPVSSRGVLSYWLVGYSTVFARLGKLYLIILARALSWYQVHDAVSARVLCCL